MGADELPTPNDFKIRSGFGFVHINGRSLEPKMDMIKVWILTADPDVFVLSETWLTKTVSEHWSKWLQCRLYRCDRAGKGGRH